MKEKILNDINENLSILNNLTFKNNADDYWAVKHLMGEYSALRNVLKEHPADRMDRFLEVMAKENIKVDALVAKYHKTVKQ